MVIAESPGAMAPVSQAPLAVAVCGTMSRLIQTMVSPAAGSSFAGWKAMPLISTVIRRGGGRTGARHPARDARPASRAADRLHPRPGFHVLNARPRATAGAAA